MISKTKELPEVLKPSAEVVKLKNMAAAYPDEIKLFKEANTGAFISILGSDAIITGEIDADEVKRFLLFSGAKSVFSTADNLAALFGNGNFEAVNVVIRENCKPGGSNTFTYDFLSREAYSLLKDGGFTLPEYEYFATDYCRRKNKGLLKVFGKKDSCIALTLEGEKYRLLSGIVSNVNGLGGALLLTAVSGEKSGIAVCRDELLPFYIKYGFKPLYKAGYWRKHN